MDFVEVFCKRWDVIRHSKSFGVKNDFYVQVLRDCHLVDAQKIFDYVGEKNVDLMREAWRRGR